jgi:crotonobetainyl-CoA:carnitine CoA-transferase CaiB-like acyl-CoA transferase
MEEHMYLQTFDPPLGPTCDPRLIDPHAGPVPTKDSYICLSATTNGQAFALFDAMGRPELKDDPRFNSVSARFANVKDYYAYRAEAMKAKTTAEWLEILDKADIPAMPYHTPDTIFDDPHLKEIEFFQWREHPTEGRVRMIRLPNKWSCGVRRDWNPAPKLGQQSVEVLKEIGVSDAEIEAMVKSGATIDGALSKTPAE